METVVFVVFPEVHLLDLTGPAHVFYEANCFGGNYELIYSNAIAGMHDVPSSGGVSFSQLTDFEQLSLKSGDLIFVPGLEREVLFDGAFIGQIRPFLNWLDAQHEAGATICSICTGSFILGYAGLLNGRSATTHWKYMDLLKEKFPRTVIVQNRFFVVEDRIYTSAGVSSGIDLALFLLEQQRDPFFAARIAREIVIYLRRGADDPQLSIFLQYRNHIEDRVHKVQDWLQQHLDQPFVIADLAAMVHISPRHLTRLFKKTIGIPLGQYVEQLRIEKASQLLREGQTLDFATRACGLKSTRHLRAMLQRGEQG